MPVVRRWRLGSSIKKRLCVQSRREEGPLLQSVSGNLAIRQIQAVTKSMKNSEVSKTFHIEITGTATLPPAPQKPFRCQGASCFAAKQKFHAYQLLKGGTILTSQMLVRWTAEGCSVSQWLCPDVSLSPVLGSLALMTERVIPGFLGQHCWGRLLYEHYRECKIARFPKC